MKTLPLRTSDFPNSTGDRFARPIAFIAVICALGLAAPDHSRAGDFVIGVGQDNFDDDDFSEATSIQLEYHADAFREYSWGGVSVMGVLEVDEDDDVYAGLGLSALWNTSETWFVEGSLAAGYYDAGSDSLDLGGDFQFRTLIGIGFRVSDSARVSLAIDHLSNAGLDDTNPGRNAVYLRYARSF